jgi:NADPH-dependent ferric siderophore reductase
VTQRLWTTQVRRTERLTPLMIRVTVHSAELTDFADNGTDQNVILYFYEPDVELPSPLTLESARAFFSTAWPTMRTYTVRRYDRERREIDIDFVVHSGGYAADWALAARPGDRLIFAGPSRAFEFAADVNCYLVAGDETALPAIGALLEQLPDSAAARVFVEIAGESEEQKLARPVTWLHRGPAEPGELLIAAVRSTPFPDGVVHAWIGAEAAAVRDLRHYLRDERGLRRNQASITVYWRRGITG